MNKTFSKNQLQRYPIYLKYLSGLASEGTEYVSSPTIAKELGYSEEQIRKDLQAVSNESGRPKKGRSVSELIESIETFLGYRKQLTAVMIGCGHLGSALLNYPNFETMGLKIAAGFDVSPKKIGKQIGAVNVYPIEELSKKLKETKAEIVMLTVPAADAQAVVDIALENGIKAIWNFAPVHLNVPANVVVENVNLASSLAILSHHLNKNRKGLGR